MLQAIIRQDGKYERLRLSDRLHEGFTEVERDKNDVNIIRLKLNKEIVEAYISEPTVGEQIYALKMKIPELDIKRIRAIAEPSIKDGSTGETWLDYRTNEIKELRIKLANLEEL